MKKVEIFTDGACKGNPGPGGWGAILRMGHHEKELSGGEAETTPVDVAGMLALIRRDVLARADRPEKIELRLDSDNLHSPNEKYDLFNFYKGIETIPYFHQYFAGK